jgi:hypothetical protein
MQTKNFRFADNNDETPLDMQELNNFANKTAQVAGHGKEKRKKIQIEIFN